LGQDQVALEKGRYLALIFDPVCARGNRTKNKSFLKDCEINENDNQCVGPLEFPKREFGGLRVFLGPFFNR
jgi:hypothetical protein